MHNQKNAHMKLRLDVVVYTFDFYEKSFERKKYLSWQSTINFQDIKDLYLLAMQKLAIQKMLVYKW